MKQASPRGGHSAAVPYRPGGMAQLAGLVLYSLCVKGKVRATRTKAPYANTDAEARGASGGGEQQHIQSITASDVFRFAQLQFAFLYRCVCLSLLASI